MGAWNYTLVGNDHVQDALFEKVDLEYLYQLVNPALKELHQEQLSGEFLESREREVFLGVIMSSLEKQDSFLTKEIVQKAKYCLASLRKWGHVGSYSEPEKRVHELDKAMNLIDDFLKE